MFLIETTKKKLIDGKCDILSLMSPHTIIVEIVLVISWGNHDDEKGGVYISQIPS